MVYGGESTKRDNGLVKVVTIIGESLGLLNKGSAQMPAALEVGEAEKATPISTNALNVSRVGGVAALITGAGAAAIALFRVEKNQDPVGVVVAAYASVGAIVAASLLAVALIIASDIRARSSIAKAGSEPSDRVDVTEVKSEETKITTLDRAYNYVLVDAGHGEVEVRLPDPTACKGQVLALVKTDDGAHNVTIPIKVGATGTQILSKTDRTLRFFSDGNGWRLLEHV